MPNTSVVGTAEGVPTFMDLEPSICDLRNMAAIADRVFDEHLSHALAMKYLDRDEADELCYAYKHLFHLATDLRSTFYMAVRNRKELPEPRKTPEENTEVAQLKARIEAWLAADRDYRQVSNEPDDISDPIDDAEYEAWIALLQFPCCTGAAKDLKVSFILSTLRGPLRRYLDEEQLETFLASLTQ